VNEVLHELLHEVLALLEASALLEFTDDVPDAEAEGHALRHLRGSADEGRSLLRGLDLEEGVSVVDLGLTGLTVVEVVADAALVAHANEGEDVASVTSHTGVAHLWGGLDFGADNCGEFRKHASNGFLNELDPFLLASSLLLLAALGAFLTNPSPIDNDWVALRVDVEFDLSLSIEGFLEGLEVLITDDVDVVTFLVNVLETKLLWQIMESATSLGDDLCKIEDGQGAAEFPRLFVEM